MIWRTGDVISVSSDTTRVRKGGLTAITSLCIRQTATETTAYTQGFSMYEVCELRHRDNSHFLSARLARGKAHQTFTSPTSMTDAAPYLVIHLAIIRQTKEQVTGQVKFVCSCNNQLLKDLDIRSWNSVGEPASSASYFPSLAYGYSRQKIHRGRPEVHSLSAGITTRSSRIIRFRDQFCQGSSCRT